MPVAMIRRIPIGRSHVWDPDVWAPGTSSLLLTLAKDRDSRVKEPDSPQVPRGGIKRVTHTVIPGVKNRLVRYGETLRVLSPGMRRLRVGIFHKVTSHYSGGRILLFQYAHCLASTGSVDVFLVSNAVPIWARDYPALPNLNYVVKPGSRVPDDLDIVISDRGEWLHKALQYRDKHPCVAIGMNFETPNWVETLCPTLGRLINKEDFAGGFAKCDYLFSCSEEGLKWLKDYLEGRSRKVCGIPQFVVPGAVNTFALGQAERENSAAGYTRVTNRRYALWVSRGVDHKNLRLCVDAIWGLRELFDLVVIGNSCKGVHDNEYHKLHFMKSVGDVEKFRLMLSAHTVLAPSLFEGYGIVPGEALAAGVVPVVFDLPVLRQVYGSRLHYIPHGDSTSYVKAVADVAVGMKETADADEAKELYGMKAMKKRILSLPCHRVDRVSVSAQFIVYWGFFPEAVEAIYPYVDQIIIAYGPVELVKKRGVEPDNSLELVRVLQDPEKKIEVYGRPVWSDKTEMHNFCCRKIRGNRMLIVGGDQIWVGLPEWIADEKIFAACPRMVHFWDDSEHYISRGKNWGESVEPFGTFVPHCLWTYWRPSFSFRVQSQVCDASYNDVNREDAHTRRGEACRDHPNTVIYHLGNLLNKRTMDAKLQFYVDRDRCNLSVRAQGKVLPVTWELPPIVRKALMRLEGTVK